MKLFHVCSSGYVDTSSISLFSLCFTSLNFFTFHLNHLFLFSTLSLRFRLDGSLEFFLTLSLRIDISEKNGANGFVLKTWEEIFLRINVNICNNR